MLYNNLVKSLFTAAMSLLSLFSLAVLAKNKHSLSPVKRHRPEP